MQLMMLSGIKLHLHSTKDAFMERQLRGKSTGWLFARSVGDADEGAVGGMCRCRQPQLVWPKQFWNETPNESNEHWPLPASHSAMHSSLVRNDWSASVVLM